MVHFFLAHVVTCIRKEMSFRCGKIRVARFLLLLLLLFSTHHTDVLLMCWVVKLLFFRGSRGEWSELPILGHARRRFLPPSSRTRMRTNCGFSSLSLSSWKEKRMLPYRDLAAFPEFFSSFFFCLHMCAMDVRVKHVACEKFKNRSKRLLQENFVTKLHFLSKLEGFFVFLQVRLAPC